jgi:ribA/ribD-fused uncharacterized protein
MNQEYLEKYCVVKNNICLFTKCPLSQWWGGFKNQIGGFEIQTIDLYYMYEEDFNLEFFRWFEDNFNVPEDKIRFNCCEQWMMACKAILSNDIEAFKEIMLEKNPSKQKDLGRTIKNFDPKLWNERKLKVVSHGNLLKFEQNPELADFLKSFHPFTIFAEAAPWDKVWGIGLSAEDPKSWDINTWEGENLLGRALMEVRRIL